MSSLVQRRWIGVSVLLTVALLGCGPGTPPRGAQLAQPAPEIQGTTLDGHALRLSEFRGRVVLLNFWATWCPPCVEEMPDLQQVADELGPQGVTVLGLSADVGDPEVVAKFLRRHRITYPVLIADESAVSAYGVTMLPTTFLVDQQGIVRQRYLGPRGRRFLAEDIHALLNTPTRR